MATEHSPLPWTTDDDWPIMDCNNNRVADLYGKSITMATANARLIVRAANNHEKLMAAIKAVLGAYQEDDPAINRQSAMDSLEVAYDEAAKEIPDGN